MELLATLLLVFRCISLTVCILMVYIDHFREKKRRTRHSQLFEPRLAIPVRRPIFDPPSAIIELHQELPGHELDAVPQLPVRELPRRDSSRSERNSSPSFLEATTEERLQALRTEHDTRISPRLRSISFEEPFLVPPARHLPRSNSANTV
jgi:hypothetical protein